MLTPSNKMNASTECDNVCVPLKKRRVDDERLVPCKKQRIRGVTWAVKPHIYVQEDVRKLFSDYNEKDIWYSKSEYDEFLVDRLRTVQCLRASGGDESALDQEFYCIRGLEPFRTADVHEELHSKRRFHQSTILIEQVRQSLLGLCDPDRFRLLVAPQSEMALRRAQELAALDEHDVSGRVCRRQSLLASVPKSASSEPLSLSLSMRVRKLQEWNARRLMEIYSQPGSNGPFRFPIRRDSLVGSTTHGMGSIAIGNRFPIRRDSLTPLGAVRR